MRNLKQQESVTGYQTSKGKTANIAYPAHPDFPQVSFDIGEDTNGDGRSEAVNKTFEQLMLQYQWSLDGGREHHDH